MVERWRKETHCFNFREGECTITLKDIAILTDLPIDGDVVCVDSTAPPKVVANMSGWQHFIWTVTGSLLVGCNPPVELLLHMKGRIDDFLQFHDDTPPDSNSSLGNPGGDDLRIIHSHRGYQMFGQLQNDLHCLERPRCKRTSPLASLYWWSKIGPWHQRPPEW
ncbi:unnamed protein product [Linum tenue]|uniref:Aminotransferase-like plant mobile domain-containing protein n=1 Tax=Linum tenue TaxID=586396 RepID=A0AAV0N0G5_9ROSI|nr:unnamed protein product [Linum tenue]